MKVLPIGTSYHRFCPNCELVEDMARSVLDWILRFLVLLSFISASSFAVSSLSVAQDSGAKGQVSLEEILLKYKMQFPIDNYSARLHEQSDAQLQLDTRRFAEPFVFSLENEIGMADSKDSGFTAKVSRSIIFGIDEDRVRERYTALASAEILKAQGERREQMKDISLLYTMLLFHQRQVRAASQTLTILVPLLNKVKRAAERGDISGLFVRRWQILRSKIEAEKKLSEKNLESIGALLREISGSDIPQDFRSVTLAELPAFFQKAEYKEEQSLPMRIAALKEKALVAQSSYIGNRWQMEAGLGHVHDFERGHSSIVLEVSVPLGAASTAKSEVQALDAERRVLAAEAGLAIAAQKRRAVVLLGDLMRRGALSDLVKGRVVELESLYRGVSAAVAKAQAEAGEIVETLSELYESKTESNEAQKDFEDSIVEYYFFVTGDEL